LTAATDNVGTVMGGLTTGDTTDDTALVLSGTNEAGATVNVYNGTTLLGAATISGTTWSYSATVANSTTYAFNVKETDTAGNESAATTDFAVTGDTSAPTANFSAATDNVGTVTGALTTGDSTDDTALVLSGTNEAGATVNVYNGTTLLGAATISGTTWSYSATVANSTTYAFNVIETDAAGNESVATGSFAVTGDTSAPTLDSSNPTDDGTDVPVTDNIVLTFAENMLASTGNIHLHATSDNALIETIAASDAKITISDTSVTINPSSDLSDSTEYYVLIDSSALTDNAGNAYAGISSSTALSFTTLAATTATTYSVVVESTGAWIDTNADGVKDTGETTAFTNSGEYTLAEDTVTIEFNDVPDTAIDLTGFGTDDRVEIDVTAWLNNEAGIHRINHADITNKSLSTFNSYTVRWIDGSSDVSAINAFASITKTMTVNDVPLTLRGGLYKYMSSSSSSVYDNTAIAVWDGTKTAALDPDFVNTVGKPLDYITLVNIPLTV
jgi:hypothetical protein